LEIYNLVSNTLRMKRLFWFLYIIDFAFPLQAQNTGGLKGIVTQSVINNRWDINKYIWSHSHHDRILPGKPLIDFQAIDNWTGLGEQVTISRDGRYFAYTVERGSVYYKKLDTLVVRSTMGSWQCSITGVKPGFFSGDSKQYIYVGQGDLCFLQTGTGERRYVKNVAGYTLPYNGRNDWFAYNLKDSSSTVVLYNLITGYESRFIGVSNYGFDESVQFYFCQLKNDVKEFIVYKLLTGQENRYSNVSAYIFSLDGNSMLLSKSNGSIVHINLVTGKETTLWSQEKTNTVVNGFNLDKNGKQAVFVIKDKQSNENAIWYWQEGMEKGVMEVNNKSFEIESDLLIGQEASFTENDHYVQFALLSKPDNRKPDLDAAQVDVWSYRDTIVQYSQQSQKNNNKVYTAILKPKTGLVMRLNRENENLVSSRGDYVIVTKKCCGDRFWEKGYGRDSNWLVSLQNGSRHALPITGSAISFSPNGHYLVYFDADKGCNYFSYDLSTGKIINISAGIPAYQFGRRDYYLRTPKKPDRFVGMTPFTAWVGNNKLIVYDDFDVWLLNLEGKNKPINITNGYGRAHHIKFELSGSGGPYRLSGNDTLLLKAFNRKTKYNGYYRKILGRAVDP
jgi:hypothetical protein